MRPDLYKPTIPPLAVPAHPPWLVGSTVYVAAFGGAVAGAGVLVVNSIRLGLGSAHRIRIVAVAAAAMVVRLLLLGSGLDLPGLLGLTTVAEGVAVFLAASPEQRRAFRAYQLRQEAPYSYLLIPGGFAVVIGWIVEGIVTVAVLGPS